MAKRVYTIGQVGYQFMGRAHSNAYRQVGRYFDLPFEVRMKTLCGRNEARVSEAAKKLGWEGYVTDYRQMLDDPEIDIVDVNAPGDAHAQIAIAAAKAGKVVFCEKPLGNTLKEAEEMYAAVESAGVPNALFHNYRKSPAVALAKKMIDDGRIGTIYHFRGHYLQDWNIDPNVPLSWRMRKDIAGSGVNGDLNAHLIDMARYLVGEFACVNGMMETFIKQRPLEGNPEQMGEVTVDDAAIFMARFQNGALGTFEATRYATGHKNYNRFEINGSKGSLIFNFERMNELEYFDNTEPQEVQGFRVIQASEGCHPYMAQYWPAGHIIGYEHTFINLVADALMALHERRPISPNFKDGLENQKVLDAVEKSINSQSWVHI